MKSPIYLFTMLLVDRNKYEYEFDRANHQIALMRGHWPIWKGKHPKGPSISEVGLFRG